MTRGQWKAVERFPVLDTLLGPEGSGGALSGVLVDVLGPADRLDLLSWPNRHLLVCDSVESSSGGW